MIASTIRKSVCAIWLLAVLSASLCAQSVSSATFVIGGGVIPAGADPSKTLVDIIDWDPLSNDPLLTGLLGFLEEDDSGNLISRDVNTVLYCQDGEVRGDNGGSGEYTANVFLRVTFRNSAGDVLKVHDTATKNVSCN